MISDVLVEAIERIRDYQQSLPEVYDGGLGQRIETVLTAMEDLRAHLDPPDAARVVRGLTPNITVWGCK